MPQTISDLWNGNITPFDHCGAHDPEVRNMIRLIQRNRESLCASLTEAQQATFQTYIDCSEEYLLRMLELAFSDGFCLGGKLVMEILM